MTDIMDKPRFRQTSALTSKQKDDINFAIMEYLKKYKFEKTYAAFTDESAINFEEYLKTSTQPTSLLKDVLERKWTSISRLKKQVMDLEKNYKQLQEINEQNQVDMQNMEREFRENGTIVRKPGQVLDKDDLIKSTGDAIPREPQKLKMMGHRARVTRCIFHPIYDQIATSSEDASIKLWNYETGDVEQTLREHTGMVNYISFNPDGQSMASCSRDMTIKLWKINKEQEFKCYKTLQGHDHEVSCVEFVKPQGDHIMSCSRDNTIRFWDSNTGFLQLTLQQHSEWVRRLTQSMDGSMMASASKDETVIIWNMDRIKQNMGKMIGDPADFIITVIDDHEHVIDCIKFAPVEAAKYIMKADYNKGQFGGGNTSTQNQSNEMSIDITVDSTGDQTREKESFDDDSQIKDQSQQHDEDSRIDASKRLTAKERVAKLKAQLEMKKKMLRGEIVDDKQEEEKQADEESSLPVDTSIQIDTSKQEKEQLEQENLNLRDFIATGSRDKKIRIFDVKSGRCVVILSGHDNWITDLYFHPNGRYLISTADDKSIRIWDLQSGRCYRKIYNAHDHFISCFDMKGKLAATGSVDTSVRIWQCR